MKAVCLLWSENWKHIVNVISAGRAFGFTHLFFHRLDLCFGPQWELHFVRSSQVCSQFWTLMLVLLCFPASAWYCWAVSHLLPLCSVGSPFHCWASAGGGSSTPALSQKIGKLIFIILYTIFSKTNGNNSIHHKTRQVLFSWHLHLSFPLGYGYLSMCHCQRTFIGMLRKRETLEMAASYSTLR